MNGAKAWKPLEADGEREVTSHREPGEEFLFYRSVAEGMIDAVQENCSRGAFENMEGVGQLSEDPVTNLRYHFVVTAAMLTRFCMEGGMAMEEAFGTRPGDVLAAIGPSICQDCYEVSQEVAQVFMQEFGQEWKLFFRQGREPLKYQLDLWRANQAVLAEAGVCKENTAVTNLCTHCNPEILFSHRSTGTARGNLSAFLALV